MYCCGSQGCPKSRLVYCAGGRLFFALLVTVWLSFVFATPWVCFVFRLEVQSLACDCAAFLLWMFRHSPHLRICVWSLAAARPSRFLVRASLYGLAGVCPGRCGIPRSHHSLTRGAAYWVSLTSGTDGRALADWYVDVRVYYIFCSVWLKFAFADYLLGRDPAVWLFWFCVG